MLTDIHIARFRGGGRPARNWDNGHLARCRSYLCFRFRFCFVRVEHVERVVARGLLDDEHETAGGDVQAVFAL